MATSMTIEEVKQAKMDLELKVLDMFKEFEEETGLKVSYINTERKRKKNKKTREDEPEAVYEPHNGPLANVNIEVNLDLVY